MSSSSEFKSFKSLMKVQEIRGQRILTSCWPHQDNKRVEIFVKNIPIHLDEDTIVPFLEKIGPVQILRLMLDRSNITNRGFAYVIYHDSDDAEIALKLLNGSEIIRGHPVEVKQSMNNCRIFLGGIPLRKTKDEVWHELTRRGVTDIVDVIMYRSYNNRAENRGFVFVEFPSHQFAAKMRNKMKNLTLWNNEVIVDWSVPEPNVPQEEMQKVKILYMRNLSVMESRESLKAMIELYIRPEFIEKVYKFKNYAFIHLTSREAAVNLLETLQYHYKNTTVEVTLAKPANENTTPQYRKKILMKATTRNIEQGFRSSLQDINSNKILPNRNIFENYGDIGNYDSSSNPGINRMDSKILEAASKILKIRRKGSEEITTSTPISTPSSSILYNSIPFFDEKADLKCESLEFSSIEANRQIQKRTFFGSTNFTEYKENLAGKYPSLINEDREMNYNKEIPDIDYKYSWPSYPCSWGAQNDEGSKPSLLWDHDQSKLLRHRLFMEDTDL